MISGVINNLMMGSSNQNLCFQANELRNGCVNKAWVSEGQTSAIRSHRPTGTYAFSSTLWTWRQSENFLLTTFTRFRVCLTTFMLPHWLMVIGCHSTEMRKPHTKHLTLKVAKHMLKRTTLFLVKRSLHLPRCLAARMLWLNQNLCWKGRTPNSN